LVTLAPSGAYFTTCTKVVAAAAVPEKRERAHIARIKILKIWFSILVTVSVRERPSIKKGYFLLIARSAPKARKGRAQKTGDCCEVVAGAVVVVVSAGAAVVTSATG